MLFVVDSELIVSIRNKFDWILPNYVVEVLPYSSHPSHNMEFCSGHLPSRFWGLLLLICRWQSVSTRWQPCMRMRRCRRTDSSFFLMLALYLCWHNRIKYCKSIYKKFFHYIKLRIFLWDLKWNHKQYAGIII